MSNNLCPKCGKPSTITIGPYYVNDFCQCYTVTDVTADLRAEISRLTSELTNARELLAMALAEGDRLNAEIESLRLQLEIEKDYE